MCPEILIYFTDHLISHTENPLYREEKQDERDELRNPVWITDEDLGTGDIKMNDTEENGFWNDLIKSYLFPLEGNKEKEKKTKEELIELRNSVCLAFMIINALFIILLFALETISQQTSNLYFTMPCNVPGLAGEKVQPIALTFTLVFGILIVMQFVAMLFHRYSTFLHIAAITEVKLKRKVIGPRSEEKPSVDETIQLVREMQAIRDDDEMSIAPDYDNDDVKPDYSDDDDEGGPKSPRGQELWSKFKGRRKGLQIHRTLNRAFMKNFNRLVSEIDEDKVEEKSKEEIHQNAQRRFRRFEKKSLYTIVKIAQANREYKQSVVKHAQRWNDVVKKLGIVRQLKSQQQLKSLADVVRAAMISQGRAKLGMKPGASQQNTPLPVRRNTRDIRISVSDPLNEGAQTKKQPTSSAWDRFFGQPTSPQAGPSSKFKMLAKKAVNQNEYANQDAIVLDEVASNTPAQDTEGRRQRDPPRQREAGAAITPPVICVSEPPDETDNGQSSNVPSQKGVSGFDTYY